MGVMTKDTSLSGSWNGPDTSCQTCPANVAVANDITVQDLDAGETQLTTVKATLQTVKGKRTLILG
jgi:hypothetical protein